MIFGWLKALMPRGLYGRAALILLTPIVVIQLAVSVVFVQRHFDGVTRQMVNNVALEIKTILGAIRKDVDPDVAAAQIRTIGEPLQISATFVTPQNQLGETRRTYYDLSASVVIDELRRQIPVLKHVDFVSNTRLVDARFETELGELAVIFRRSRVTASNPHQLLVFMVFTSIVITLISFMFLRNQLRPIRRLARAAEAFGKGRSVPYAPSGASEVRAAGNAFLDMRERIEKHIEQRTLMLSGVSHDLRTPLTRLKLGLSMIEGEGEAVELGKDVDAMEAMLDEFLAFARGDSTEELAATDPASIARTAVEDARRLGTAITLDIDAPARDVRLPLRRRAVTRALDNLIGNAGRHGAKVIVRVGASDDAVCFTVEDDGPGIAPADREVALRPFARLDRARNQNVGGGVGLGLSIATDIAHSHGGALRLDRSAELGGLAAILTLPR